MTTIEHVRLTPRQIHQRKIDEHRIKAQVRREFAGLVGLSNLAGVIVVILLGLHWHDNILPGVVFITSIGIINVGALQLRAYLHVRKMRALIKEMPDGD